MIAIKYDVGNPPEVVDVENTLSALQEAVGGHIETVRVAEDLTLLVDEEGLIKGLPYNRRMLGKKLYGPILAVGVAGEEFCGIPVHQIGMVMRMGQQEGWSNLDWTVRIARSTKAARMGGEKEQEEVLRLMVECMGDVIDTALAALGGHTVSEGTAIPMVAGLQRTASLLMDAMETKGHPKAETQALADQLGKCMEVNWCFAPRGGDT